MIWIATAVVLAAWLCGVLLGLGQWINLFLLLAAVLLVYGVASDREHRSQR